MKIEKLSGLLLTEFLNYWKYFVQSEHGGANSMELAEIFFMFGRKSLKAEFEVEFTETEYGKKLRQAASLPDEIEIEKAFYKEFFKEREGFSVSENNSWISGAKTATKVFFKILRGEKW